MTDEANRLAKRYRHKKRGSEYDVIGRAELQMSFDYLVDGSEMVVYRGDDGKLWVREESEFLDGRFEPVAALRATDDRPAPQPSDDAVEKGIAAAAEADRLHQLNGAEKHYSHIVRAVIAAVQPDLVAQERAGIVAWLRQHPGWSELICDDIADAIELREDKRDG